MENDEHQGVHDGGNERNRPTSPTHGKGGSYKIHKKTGGKITSQNQNETRKTRGRTSNTEFAVFSLAQLVTAVSSVPFSSSAFTIFTIRRSATSDPMVAPIS